MNLYLTFFVFDVTIKQTTSDFFPLIFGAKGRTPFFMFFVGWLCYELYCCLEIFMLTAGFARVRSKKLKISEMYSSNLIQMLLQFDDLKTPLRHYSLIPPGGGGLLSHTVAHIASTIKVCLQFRFNYSLPFSLYYVPAFISTAFLFS